MIINVSLKSLPIIIAWTNIQVKSNTNVCFNKQKFWVQITSDGTVSPSPTAFIRLPRNGTNQHLHHRIQGGHNSTDNTMALRYIHSCPVLFNFILLSLYCPFKLYMLHINQFVATLPFFPRQFVNDYYLLLDFTLMVTPWLK